MGRWVARWKLSDLFIVAAVAAVTAIPVAAREVPLDKQKGVRGRVIVAPELLSTPARLSPERERLIKSAAIVRRPLGREITPILEQPPQLVVMLEGAGLRSDAVPTPQLVLRGMRLTPGSIVTPRPMAVSIENRQSQAVTIVDATGEVRTTINPGAKADVQLPKAGEWLLTVEEMPWASAEVRVLERGRVLPINAEDEIPLTEIQGGEYTLTVFAGAEPLRIQPLVVPDDGLVFIDAAVSALKVVEISIKDASMRVAVPPSINMAREPSFEP